ncbi:phage major capsid protein [Allonocardiopsis opalescens]|uniref:HK97 family phage major capsid protein n=1 Tax=Allonocardiopsis opalescens TaxID=1144618 RepID=A0A2T0PW46_9ACTN|nr:phage major capsid protein [Allonocardiopsis opalescens]PRX95578.1 HK97 family phage major capsid protein [Allonocardiopsis opalescens]
MPYNNITSRSDAEALIPEEVSRELLGKATESSAVLQLFRRVPVSRNAVRFPVLSALPVAYWVTGDTGLKQTTEVAWTNKFMNIEEIATIVPVPENVVDDVELDIWDEVMPYIEEAFARTLDSAVFFGTNAPASFPTNVVAAALAAGNDVAEGTATAAQGGVMGDLDNLIAEVEEDGYDVTGFAAARSARRLLRAARDTTGQRTDAGRVSADLATLDGLPIAYPMRGQWPTGGAVGSNVRLLAGDFSNQFIVGVRQDITLKVLTEAVIQDNTGAIVYNLAQQDMVALRIKARFGWQVANTINNDQPTEATRYPAAVLTY